MGFSLTFCHKGVKRAPTSKHLHVSVLLEAVVFSANELPVCKPPGEVQTVWMIWVEWIGNLHLKLWTSKSQLKHGCSRE